jgi:hypothetical protein
VATVRLERADAILPWEHPDALDLEVSLVAPDGIVYEGFRMADDVPGTDLNASLTGVVLPQTGRWLVIAGTTKGSGGYRLTFELVSAPAPSSAQLRPVDDTHRTLTTGGTVKPIAFFFDPEGRPMSGARVQWLKTPEAGDAANISFPSDGLAPTTTRGFSQTTGTVTSLGTVGFGPSLLDAGVQATAASAPSGAFLTAGAGDASSPDTHGLSHAPAALAYVGIHLRSIDPWSGTMELTVDEPKEIETLGAQPERVQRGGEDFRAGAGGDDGLRSGTRRPRRDPGSPPPAAASPRSRRPSAPRRPSGPSPSTAPFRAPSPSP